MFTCRPADLKTGFTGRLLAARRCAEERLDLPRASVETVRILTGAAGNARIECGERSECHVVVRLRSELCLIHSLLARALVLYGCGLPNHPRKWWLHDRLRRWLGIKIDQEARVKRCGLQWFLNPADHAQSSLFVAGRQRRLGDIPPQAAAAAGLRGQSTLALISAITSPCWPLRYGGNAGCLRWSHIRRTTLAWCGTFN